MRRLPLLLALVVGVALWAAPSLAQVTGEWWPVYIENGLLPGEGVEAIDEFGGALCPFNSAIGCSGPSEAYHHIPPSSDVVPVYATHVLDVSACNNIRVRVKEMDNDIVVAHMYLQATLDDTGAGNLCANPKVAPPGAGSEQSYILGDVNGDGVINDADEVPLDGDDGTDSEGDGTARQTGALYDVIGENFVRLCIMRTGGAHSDVPATVLVDSSYADIGCR